MGKERTDMASVNTTRARCAQCGRELKNVPFNVKNVVCKDCYGLDRYRRVSSPLVEKQMEATLASEEETP
jgi:ribosomal protein L37E